MEKNNKSNNKTEDTPKKIQLLNYIEILKAIVKRNIQQART